MKKPSKKHLSFDLCHDTPVVFLGADAIRPVSARLHASHDCLVVVRKKDDRSLTKQIVDRMLGRNPNYAIWNLRLAGLSFLRCDNFAPTVWLGPLEMAAIFDKGEGRLNMELVYEYIGYLI